jgi:exonuclease III
MKFRLIFISIIFYYQIICLIAQNNTKVALSCIAFYNIENLFDTINDPTINDDDFTPTGSYQWTYERYQEKLDNLSYVIDKIGNKYAGSKPAVIGLAEVENRGVLEDLVQTEILRPLNYKIVHYDSPDRRGVDVALLYNPQKFIVYYTQTYTLVIPDREDFYTRDQLIVSGLLGGDTIDIIVVHWPSRRGGAESVPYRQASGDLTRHIVDSIMQSRSNAKIIVMGDFNDDPTDSSLRKHLRANGKKEKMQAGDLYNPYLELFKKGIGSLAYQGKWNLFDQIIISPALLDNDKNSWELYSAYVFNESFLIQDTGRFAGYPFRTYAGGSYMGGYSDHFPSYIMLVKKVNEK